ncbi:MAG: enoyl-CoA hydratase/isomerase family protein [Chloroflexi bacterium]|nr:enoyl-CoA hydratase/isomerase family protein [Chloroflexota bacterium]
MSGFETIIYEKDEAGVARLTLNRPDVLNAVNLQMRDELWSAFEAFRDDPDARVLILRGAGRAFSAGADISEFGTTPSFVEARRARHERDLWGLLLHLPKPTIAAVHGYALGAGCEMSLLCDLRVASGDAQFGLPEVSLGYIPSAGGTQTLPRTIPPGVALSMILSGDPIDANEAYRLGLVHRIVPRDQLDSAADAWARTLAQRSPQALSYAKEAVLRGLDLSLADGLALEARLAGTLVLGRQRNV